MSDPTDEDLYLEAIGDKTEPVAEPEPVEAKEPEPEPAPEVKAEETPPEAAEPEGEPDPVAEEKGGNIPSYRLKEEADKRRAAEERTAEIERREAEARQQNATLLGRLEQMERQIAQGQKPAQPEAEPIDLYTDPDAFAANLQSTVQQQLRQNALSNNLQMHAMVHGDKFNAAFTELTKSGDQEAAARAMASPNPGKAIMDWHQNRTIVAETGGDLTAYREKLREEMLNDPEILKQLGERLKAGGGNPAPAAGQPAVVIPPSLSKSTGSASRAEKIPETEDELWAYATSKSG